MNSLSISTLLTPPSSLLPSTTTTTTTTTSLKLRNPSSFKSSTFSIQSHLSSSSSNTNSNSKTLTDSENLGLKFNIQNSAYSISSSLNPMAQAPPQQAQRGPETADPMGMLLRERIVFLGHEIDDVVADTIVSQLLLLDAQDPTKDIRLFINSPGGSLSATMAIYDVVQLVRADVSTIALGIVASTASIILGGGTKGKRLAMPNTRIMAHQPLGGASGKVNEVEIQAKEIMQNKQNVIRIISDFTGRTPEQVEEDIDRDRYMSPIEAVEFGFVDGVIDRDYVIPLMPVPEKVKQALFLDEITTDVSKFIKPDIPDDEIY